MKYSVERWGSGTERIIFVHGSLGYGAAAFGEQQPLGDRFTLDVVTRRGYGDNPPIGAVDVLADAHDVIEILGEGAHLVGTSMGGIVAMNAAGLRPDLIRSLTVIEPPAFALAADLPEVRRVSDAMRRHWRTADPSDLHAFVSGFVEALEVGIPIPEPLPAPMAATVRNLVTERPWKVDVPIGAIDDATYPKLVVVGGWSKAFDAIGRRLADLLETDLHVLTGAGHAVQKVGQPFNDLLVRHVENSRQAEGVTA